MSFDKETKNGIAIIRIKKKRLDSNVAPGLKAELLLLVNQGIKQILIDISSVDYVDSSGLGALIFGLRQLRGEGGTLKIFGANNRITSLIHIAKLEQQLVNFENEKAALESFKPA